MQFIYRGSRFQQSGTTMQKVKPLHEMARRASVHYVRKGYPAKPFETEEDVAAYTSGDTICCLLCGRHLKQLGAHLAAIHNTDAREYRARFNIPWRYALDGAATRERKRLNGLKPENRERIRKLGMDCKSTGYRPRCKLGQAAIDKGRRSAGYGGWKHDDFSWHLAQVRTVWGRPRPPEGLASWGTFKKRCSVDPALRAAYLEARAARPVHERTVRRRKNA